MVLIEPDEIEPGTAELVEFGALSLAEWARLVGSETMPFGAATAGLEFRAKDRHVGIRDGAGRLLAAAGATVATVEVAGHEPFEVVGLGALIVRRDMRGRGLSAPIMDRVTQLVESLGPDRAMLLCEPHLLSLYRTRGYAEIPDPVSVDQVAGRVMLPMSAMWRPIRPTHWPAGPVRIHGLPF